MTESGTGAPDDAALVRDVAAGSEEALGALYDRHVSAVFATASRLTSDRQIAEEVVQETFLALWNRAELFDPMSGSLAAWLHTIARNRAVDRLRAMGRRPNLIALSDARGADEPDTAALERIASSGTVLGGARPWPDPEASLDAAELRTSLRDALDGMPEVERTVILLAYRDDLTQSEIAQRLGWPLGTVKTRTRRALLRLRMAIGDGADLETGMVPISVPAHET